MSEKSELVSIVITTHNRGDRLEYAVKSATNQTYRHTEVIVVDDNSDNLVEREKTEAIINKYPNVRLVKNTKNLGGAISRNEGIKAARGKMISFLDDDDQYLPSRIEKLYKIIKLHENDNIGLAYCSCDAINENSDIVNEYVNVANGKPFYEHMMNCVAGTSMWLAPKKVLENIGGFDDVPSKQDSTVILKMMDAGYNIYGTEEKLVLFLEHSGERISGLKISNIEGIKKYREKCRNSYGRLLKKQISMVECNFSNSLITVYLANGDVSNAKRELANIRRYKPISKMYFKNAIKILFRKKYAAMVSARRRQNG